MLKVHPSIRKALVTGASGGLGKSLAVALSGSGVVVYGTSRNPDRLPSQIERLKLDLSSAEAFENFITNNRHIVSDIDLLINNAGFGVFAPFEEQVPKEQLAQLEVLLKGPIGLCHHAYPAMRQRGFGVIINITSLAGEWPLPYCSLYSTAKAGLSGFSRALMLEAHTSGVAVIDFQPGDIRTGFNDTMRTMSSAQANPALQPTWNRLEANLQAAPDAEVVARQVLRLLRKPRSGAFTGGGWFQRWGAPLGIRFLTLRQRLGLIRRYDSVQPQGLSR